MLWKELMKANKPKAKEAAIAFAICYTTGGRMGEVLALKFEDARLKRDEGREFYTFHIRSSKTDPFCKRQETLNLPLSVEHCVPIAQTVRGMFDKNKRGKKQNRS